MAILATAASGPAPKDLKHDHSKKMSHHLFLLAMEEDMKTAYTKKTQILEHKKENT